MGSVGCHYTMPSSVPGECSEETSWLGLMTSSNRYRPQEHYYVWRLITQDGFGKVYLAQPHGTGMQVAMKELTKAGVRAASIVSEVGLLKDLQHPNTTQLLEVTETKDKVYLVLEYVMGVALRKEIRRSEKNRLREKDAQRISQDISGAVDYCHDCGIVHGDLNPQNVLIDAQGCAKVCDFAMGIQFLPGQEVSVVGGTLAFCAPETISCQWYEGPPMDVWALGVILYEMVTGDHLFHGGKSQIINNILHGMVSYPNFVSNNAKNLINKILNHNPMMQPTVQKVLKHRWIRGVQPPSPPELLAVPTKRAILSRMAGMGFDPLVVMDTLRRKEYNHEMATFLLLQSQAFQGLGFRNPVKPVHKAAEKTLWGLTSPAPSAHIPWRRASEPVPCTGCLFPGLELRGEEGSRGSQPLMTIQRTPTPSLYPKPGPATPSLSSQPVPVMPIVLPARPWSSPL
ncbi:sperm motility kinase 2B-like [Fukomys damarensis]|uniref:sperm motility kinase 2B-like n=1 Tax=Fukomys damarensis TaxID=885580 RepID=UPI0014555B1B|nr:sperm motility kinase 2B-like [Fukomys damarensis]